MCTRSPLATYDDLDTNIIPDAEERIEFLISTIRRLEARLNTPRKSRSTIAIHVDFITDLRDFLSSLLELTKDDLEEKKKRKSELEHELDLAEQQLMITKGE